MLSDEEKAVLKTAKENYGLTSAEQKILVNLIEKQSKEIEELKLKNEQLEFLYSDCCKCILNTVNKDKIKAIITELQSLLEKE